MIKDVKLLDRVIGTDKHRTLSIVQLYAQGYSEQEIADIYRLTEGRISQILKPNKALCNEITLSLADQKKARRLRVIDRNIRLKEYRSKKDVMDWIECERKEIEGENRTNVHVGDVVVQTPHAVIFSALKQDEAQPQKAEDECLKR